jgi:hypothetical protein
MVKKTIPNQGRQSVEVSWRHNLGKLRRVLTSRKTLSLMMGWLRIVVLVSRLFDRW